MQPSLIRNLTVEHPLFIHSQDILSNIHSLCFFYTSPPLLWAGYLCPLQMHMLKTNPNVIGFAGEDFEG